MLGLINTLLVTVLVFSGYAYGQNKCDALLDLTLIVDSSGSISPADFERAKMALIDIVSRLNVNANKAGVAVINYASNITLSATDNVFEFEQIELLKQIGALPHFATNTATGDALALAGMYCSAKCRMLGDGTPRIFAIFTDGHSNEGQPVGPAAREIRETLEGTIFAVGVGNIGPDGNAELLEIADDPSYVMNIDSYTDLLQVTNAIATKFCDIPAFVLPDRKVMGEARGTDTRYYRMRTLHKLAKNAFFEIQVTDRVGQSQVFTSTTSKNPTGYGTRSVTDRSTGTKTYTTYVPASAKNFYFSIKGVKPSLNQFEFTVKVRQLNF